GRQRRAVHGRRPAPGPARLDGPGDSHVPHGASRGTVCIAPPNNQLIHDRTRAPETAPSAKCVRYPRNCVDRRRRDAPRSVVPCRCAGTQHHRRGKSRRGCHDRAVNDTFARLASENDLVDREGLSPEGLTERYLYSSDMVFRYAFGRWWGNTDLATT